jgi:YHS domain-containing protein
MIYRTIKTKPQDGVLFAAGLFAAFVVLVALAGCRNAAPTTTANGFAQINTVNDGPALRGYDAVAYFTENKPVQGKPEFSHSYNGANWRFATAQNRDAFAANPAKYAPQYGGYCSYAVARGYTANGDPLAWRIVNGKLYLNYSLEVRELWEKDVSGYVQKADQNWPQFFKTKPEHKG